MPTSKLQVVNGFSIGVLPGRRRVSGSDISNVSSKACTLLSNIIRVLSCGGETSERDREHRLQR